MARLKTMITKAAKPVQHPFNNDPEDRYAKDNRHAPLPVPSSEETGEVPEELNGRRATEFTSFEVTSSKGKKYRVVVPSTYAAHVPKVWSWDTNKLLVAELIAQGMPISHIVKDPQVGISSRMTVYAWLEHPEFREHVDALVTETGFASQRERIAGLSRMTQKLFDKLINELSGVKITDKSIGAIISGIQNGMKHLAQEKGEFIEQQHVQQETNISGNLAVASMKAEDLIASAADEERDKLRDEFNRLGDEVIRGLIGDKP